MTRAAAFRPCTGQDLHLEEGGAVTFRTKLQLPFKYEHEH